MCVISPAYLQSVWCAAEIGAARTLGTELLPVRVSAEPIDDRLLRLQQYVDAAADPTDARMRLQLRLRGIDGAGGWAGRSALFQSTNVGNTTVGRCPVR